MTIAERLEYTHRRLLGSNNGEQEVAIFGEFLDHLSKNESFPEIVRYFTTRLDEVVLKLRQLTTQIKPPGQFARLENPQLWSSLAWALVDSRLPQVSRDLFASMYEFQLAQQAELRRRFYKGVSLQNLGWTSYLLGEQVTARRAVLLALVEEIINTLDMDESTQLRVVSANPSYLMLRQTFKIPSAELEDFVRFSRNYARTHPGRCAYPEDCFVGYLRSIATRRSQSSIDQISRVSHFNHAYFTTLLDMVGHSVTNDVSEALLADLACYLFATVDNFQLCEQDYALPANGFNLIVRNSIMDDPVIAELGDYFAVEWRYWVRGLGATGMLAIAGKLRLAGIQTAILFTRDGDPGSVTSVPSRMVMTAQQIYQQDKLRIIIITQTDLVDIERKVTNLPALLKLKSEAMRFNRVQVNISTQLPPALGDVQSASAQAGPIIPAPAPAPIVVATPPPLIPPPQMATPYNQVNESQKPPRLVIRNTKSPKSFDNQPQIKIKNITESSNRPAEKPPSHNYKAVVVKQIETPILNPCTNCRNQTSLVCKKCSRSFCNVHLNMSEMRCESCMKAPEQEPEEKKPVEKKED
jgi:hypothetical protein